jgi:hypothetical protein
MLIFLNLYSIYDGHLCIFVSNIEPRLMSIYLNYTLHMTESSCKLFLEDYISIIVLCVYSCDKIT